MIIKRFPEDFSVEEMLTPEAGKRILRNPGPHVLYRLAKRGLGTDEALEEISRALSLPPGALCAVGLKDKHAVTVQYLSLEAPEHDRAGAPELVERPRWKLERIGWLDDRLRHTDVAGSRFRIVPRRLTRRQCTAMEEAAHFLAASPRGTRTLRFVNYFGEQRFGSARHGRGFAARHLISGEFEEALKLIIATPSRKDSHASKLVKQTIEANWQRSRELATMLPTGPEKNPARRLRASNIQSRSAFAALPSFIRRMTIEAYQSWLWNEIARRVVVERCTPPLIGISTKFGRLAFPRSADMPGPIVDLVIPLLSSKSSLEAPWRSAAEEVLGSEGIKVGDLRVPGLREPYFGEVPRALFVDATEFSLGPLEPDESMEEKRMFKRRLRFFLPRGSYATVLLRGLGGEARGSS